MDSEVVDGNAVGMQGRQGQEGYGSSVRWGNAWLPLAVIYNLYNINNHD